MRLLKTRTKDLEMANLSEKEIANHKYAILSHTWEEGTEVLFEDIARTRPNDEQCTLANGALLDARKKKGFWKVEQARRQAEHDGLDYIWIDTCCIDKSSSAELSEAINSMYSWYRNADTCYAYLADVKEHRRDRQLEIEKQLKNSKWFKRGWTLQELLAPKDVYFFSKGWEYIGRKTEMHVVLYNITNIDSTILTGRASVDTASIARRMSWAADRQTTRTEDIAYCLMGLFSVNMPMLYGEGSRAFQRLQEEIAKKSDDPTLFCWFRKENAIYTSAVTHGLLADSPADFRESAGMVPRPGQTGRAKISTTNEGMKIEVGLVPTQYGYIATLGCMNILSSIPSQHDDYVSIFLEAVSKESNQFVRRIEGNHLFYRRDRGDVTEITVHQTPPAPSSDTTHVLLLRHGPSRQPGSRTIRLANMAYTKAKYTAAQGLFPLDKSDIIPDSLESRFMQNIALASSSWIPPHLPTAFVLRGTYTSGDPLVLEFDRRRLNTTSTTPSRASASSFSTRNAPESLTPDIGLSLSFARHYTPTWSAVSTLIHRRRPGSGIDVSFETVRLPGYVFYVCDVAMEWDAMVGRMSVREEDGGYVDEVDEALRRLRVDADGEGEGDTVCPTS